MPSYLIISPHTKEECLKCLDHVLAAGYLTHFQWACPAGEHTGYLLIEAESKTEAMLIVPAFVRNKAKVIELCQFDPEQVRSMHEGKE
jgi:hypothetical protein